MGVLKTTLIAVKCPIPIAPDCLLSHNFPNMTEDLTDLKINTAWKAEHPFLLLGIGMQQIFQNCAAQQSSHAPILNQNASLTSQNNIM